MYHLIINRKIKQQTIDTGEIFHRLYHRLYLMEFDILSAPLPSKFF